MKDATHRHQWQKTSKRGYGTEIHFFVCKCGKFEAYDMDVIDRTVFTGRSEGTGE